MWEEENRESELEHIRTIIPRVLDALAGEPWRPPRRESRLRLSLAYLRGKITAEEFRRRMR